MARLRWQVRIPLRTMILIARDYENSRITIQIAVCRVALNSFSSTIFSLFLCFLFFFCLRWKNMEKHFKCWSKYTIGKFIIIEEGDTPVWKNETTRFNLESLRIWHRNNFQDTYASMRDLYYKNGDGFLLVYSITDSSSLEDVKERYQSLLTQRVGFKDKQK